MSNEALENKGKLMAKLFVYSTFDEIIVTTEKKEAQTIADFFTDEDRDIDDYEHEVFKDSFAISPELRVRWAS